MKHITTIVVLILLFTDSTKAQKLDTIIEVMNSRNNNFWNSVVRILPVDDSSFIVPTLHGSIYKVSNQGKVMWSTIIPYSNFNPVIVVNAQILFKEDTRILIINTWEDGCDYWNGGKSFLFDLDGNFIDSYFLYKTALGLNSNPYLGEAFPRVPNLPKYLFAMGDSLVFWHSRDSMSFLPQINILKSAAISSQGDIILATADSLFLMKKDTNMFFITAGIQFGHALSAQSKIYLSSDSTFVLRENKYFTLFNFSLQMLGAYYVPDADTVKNFYWHQPYFIFRTGIENNSNILILDQELNEVFRSKYKLPSMYSDDMVWNPDSILTVASMQYYEGTEGFNFIKTIDYSAEGINIHHDIGLSEATFSDSKLLGDTTCMGAPIFDSYVVEDVRIKITNPGHFPVQTAMLTSTVPYCDFYCYPTPFFHQALSNLDLLPGQSKVIDLGDIKLEKTRQTNPKDFCLVIMLPDQHFEGDLTNNVSCLQKTVSISDPVYKAEFEIFPNPTSGELNLKNPGNKKVKWNISDADGKIVQQQIRYKLVHESIDISSLSPGYYLLQLMDEEQKQQFFKVIKL